MELVVAGVPLALSTMFSLIGAGTFMVLAVIAEAFPVERRRLASIDALSAIPSLAAVLGLVAAWFALQDQAGAVALLRGLDGTVQAAVVAAAASFSIAALAYGAMAAAGKLTERSRKPFVRVVGALGLLHVGALGVAHTLAADPAWGTLATPAQMLGLALLGGAALAMMMLESAGALDGRATKGRLAGFAAVGALLGMGGFVVQVAFVLGMEGAGGADLVRAASTHLVVGLFCLAAAFAFTLMALRLKEKGFHSVIAVVSAFIGVFCIRLAFYALQVG